MSKQVAAEVIEHPDKDEILVKLVSDSPPKEVTQWLSAKYRGQPSLIISVKSLQTFKADYLDFYTKIREDLFKTHANLRAPETDLKQEIEGSAAYKKKLAAMVDKEMDIKSTIQKLVTMIEHRAEQVFDMIQEDPRNIKMDRSLIEWLNLLLSTLEKFDRISNGNPDQITINNSINVQMVDSHINMIYGVIRETLSQIDTEASLLFTELFTRRLQEIKAQNDAPTVTVEKRLEAAYQIRDSVESKIEG